MGIFGLTFLRENFGHVLFFCNPESSRFENWYTLSLLTVLPHQVWRMRALKTTCLKITPCSKFNPQALVTVGKVAVGFLLNMGGSLKLFFAQLFSPLGSMPGRVWWRPLPAGRTGGTVCEGTTIWTWLQAFGGHCKWNRLWYALLDPFLESGSKLSKRNCSCGAV